VTSRSIFKRCARFLPLTCVAAFFPATRAQAPPSTALPAITLQNALTRARQYGGQVQSATLAALQAKEDTAQTRAARLPSVNAFNQFIYTEGNRTLSGVFVANDGVHVYNEQAVVHEEALAYIRHGEINRALAAEAVARARVDVAARGVTATVVSNYYAIVLAQRKLINVRSSLGEAQRFFELTQQQERGGEVARADVVKAQIDLQQRQRDLQEAQLAIDKARIGLGVLIFPNLTVDFSVADDLQPPALLPPMEEARSQAVDSSPDLRAATAGVQEAGGEMVVARYGYIPSLGLDFFYGLDANQFLVRTPHPAPENGYRQNLGYVAQATLNIPVWNWGATRSKIKQAEIKRDQARLDLTLTQRELQGNLATGYAEARGAQAQLESLRSSVDLAAESLRLVLLRYQAGESTALEVVDAQNTSLQARNAYDEGLARYRVALANLQILMGTI
jgi:outer membrane protein TolC